MSPIQEAALKDKSQRAMEKLQKLDIEKAAAELIEAGLLARKADGTFEQRTPQFDPRKHRSKADMTAKSNTLMKKLMAESGDPRAHVQKDGSIKANDGSLDLFQKDLLKNFTNLQSGFDKTEPVELTAPAQAAKVAEVVEIPSDETPEVEEAIVKTQSDNSLKEIGMKLIEIGEPKEGFTGDPDQQMSKEQIQQQRQFIKKLMVDMKHPAVKKDNNYRPKKGAEPDRYESVKVDPKKLRQFYREVINVIQTSSDLSAHLTLQGKQLTAEAPSQEIKIAKGLQSHVLLQKNSNGQLEAGTSVSNDRVAKGNRQRYIVELMHETGDPNVRMDKQGQLTVNKDIRDKFEQDLIAKYAPKAEMLQEAKISTVKNVAEAPMVEAPAIEAVVAPAQEAPKQTLAGRVIAFGSKVASMAMPHLRKVAAVVLLAAGATAYSLSDGKEVEKKPDPTPDKLKTNIAVQAAARPEVAPIVQQPANTPTINLAPANIFVAKAETPTVDHILKEDIALLCAHEPTFTEPAMPQVTLASIKENGSGMMMQNIYAGQKAAPALKR